ncbi:MAG: hypothetical protein MR270_00640 [Erysipelotrichaceae bacterium]|nr:hypothetical protein [Erysipelotrichaceae bacterium]
METITIEKVIKFENVIDSIDSLVVNNDLRYQLEDDDTHATGKINLTGSVNTVLGRKDFNDDVDIDIYAPFEKKLSKDNFKIEVKDYSYMVNQHNLIVYLVLSINGIISQDEKVNNQENKEEKEDKENSEILDSINNLNEINQGEDRKIPFMPTLSNKNDNIIESQTKENNKKEECKVNIKDNENKEIIDSTWATDLFKLTDNYSLFMKIHVD